MSRLVLWRHAPTPANAAGTVQGRIDVALDEAGRARAAWAAERIVARAAAMADPVARRDASSLIPRDFEAAANLRVFSSPLRRCIETAQALTALVGGTVIVDDAFTQRSYGAWEGLTWREVREQYPREFARREAGFDPGIPGWDGQEAVAARVLAGLERVWSPDVPAVIVTHGSPITLGLLAAIGQPASSTVLGRVPHASAATLTKVESGAWHIEAFGLGAE